MHHYHLSHSSHIDQIVAQWKSDKIALYPTDTLWGIWSTISVHNILRIKHIKSRSADKLFMSIIAPSRSRIEQHGRCVDIKLLQQQFELYQWVTYIIPLQTTYVSRYQSVDLTADDTIWVRICNHPIQDIVARLWEPIISTSANISGQTNSLSYDEINPEIAHQVDFHIIWELLYAKPSTLINTLTGEIIMRS